MAKKAKQPRFSKWSWEDFAGLEDLPIADLDRIRQALCDLRVFHLANPLNYFFATVLAPHYNRLVHSGLNREAGFVIYRLSDQLAPEVRATVDVAPRRVGDPWYTLQEWRLDFLLSCKNGEGDIPQYLGERPLLPEF